MENNHTDIGSFFFSKKKEDIRDLKKLFINMQHIYRNEHNMTVRLICHLSDRSTEKIKQETFSSNFSQNQTEDPKGEQP